MCPPLCCFLSHTLCFLSHSPSALVLLSPECFSFSFSLSLFSFLFFPTVPIFLSLWRSELGVCVMALFTVHWSVWRDYLDWASPGAGPGDCGVYKDVDVSAEIDGLSNMQDIAEAGSRDRVSSKATHWEIKGGWNDMQPGCVMLRALDVKWRQQRTSQGIRVILISWFTLFSFSPPFPFHLTLMNASTLTQNQKTALRSKKYSPLISSN